MFAFVRHHQSYPQSLQHRTRTGAATVEFAVTLPMVAALVFGSIEASNAVFLEQALTVAAYEAGNVASKMGGDSDSATDQANSVLSAFGVNCATITIIPTVTPDTPIGTPIVITCSAPLGSNTVTTWCIGNMTQSATYTVPRL